MLTAQCSVQDMVQQDEVHAKQLTPTSSIAGSTDSRLLPLQAYSDVSRRLIYAHTTGKGNMSYNNSSTPVSCAVKS